MADPKIIRIYFEALETALKKYLWKGVEPPV